MAVRGETPRRLTPRELEYVEALRALDEPKKGHGGPSEMTREMAQAGLIELTYERDGVNWTATRTKRGKDFARA